MDVISLLLTPFALVKVATLTKLEAEKGEAIFAKQELMKALMQARKERDVADQERKDVINQLIKVNQDLGQIESEAMHSEEEKILAVAQLETVKSEVSYLRQQVEIYQRRLGLLPQERQGQTEATLQKPLRAARVPFAVAAANVQKQRTEDYWRAKANAVELADGVTGTTSSDTPTVSDKES